MTTSLHSTVVRDGSTSKRLNLSLKVQADGEITTKQLNGRDHLVVPAVILVEGVLWSSNAPHPALALASEFGIFPESWDGRPVVYNHPKRNGQAVSANHPDLWDSEVIGQLFDSGMKGKKKLRTYMWLDKEKTPSEVLETLDSGGTVEVSTGLYALEESSEGDYEGEEYKVIWRNIVPDHLAVLPKGAVGACSVEDGCGAPRANATNAQGASMPTPNAQNTQSTQDQANAGASAGAGEAGASAAIEAAPTANAQSQLTAQAGAQPNTNCGCQGNQNQPQDNAVATLNKLRQNVRAAFSGFLNSLGFKLNELSDVDKRTAIEAALNEMYKDGSYYCYVLALYSKEVVYQCLDMNEGYEWHTYKASYKVADGGKVTLGSDVVEVRPETQYVPLEITVNTQPQQNQPNTEGSTMANTQQAAAAASQSATASQPAANSQPTEQAPTQGAAAPAAAAAAQQGNQAATQAAGAAQTAQTAAPVANQQPAKTMDELLANADPALAEQVKKAMAANSARQQALVQALSGKVGLSADELKTLPIESLEKMAAKLNAAPVDYSGAAPASQPAANTNSQEKNFTPAPRVFEAPAPATRQ